MKVIITFFILIFFAGNNFSQKANYWYFGQNAGLNFNTIPPTVSTIGAISMPDNSSTISDNNGNLLFYTNGSTVYNKQHNIMSNGTGLTGHTSGGQCAVIVPQPCSANRYIIFHTTEFSSPGYLSYSVVDMSLNSGLGGVVSTEKNISLGSGWTEKLCVIYNSGGNSYWVLSHKWGSSQFVAFNVTSTSIAVTSVTTPIGSPYTCGSYGGAHDAMGQLTISKDGTKVLSALTCQDKFEIFEFNLNNGILSNSISIPGDGGKAWGTAFSPDSKKIFTSTIFGQSVYQYDITNYSQSSIINSKITLATAGNAGYNFGYMELGPDNKLYIAKPGSSFLSVVNNPDVLGTGSSFVLLGQTLGSQTSSHGTSRIAYNIPPGTGIITPSITSNTQNLILCRGESITLTASGAVSYTWNTNANGPAIIVSPTMTTTYNVIGNNSCSMTAVTVSVVTSGTINVTSSHTICTQQQIILSASGTTSFSWSTGPTTPTISVSPFSTTVYSVTGSNGNNCFTSKTVTVNVSECLGIEENRSEFSIHLYPNPANEEIKLHINEMDKEGECMITIMNTMGDVIYVNESFNTHESMNIESLKSGVYYMSIRLGTGIYLRKVIKQ